MTNKQPIIFVAGVVQDSNTIRTVAQVSDQESKFMCSWILRWTRDDGKWAKFTVPWVATQIQTTKQPELRVLATGPDGRVLVLTTRGSTEEQITDGTTSTHLHGYIRRLNIIEGVPFACGMSRQVFRREDTGTWVREDSGVLAPVGSRTVVGFNGIDGITKDLVYAVGFSGEIWRRNLDGWQQMPEVTNLLLNDVKVVDKDLVFVCGKLGILLRGHDASWEIIDHGIEQEFWSMAWFKGSLYVASMQSLYKLNARGKLESVNLPGCSTFGYLHEKDGLLLSVGGTDVAITEDATQWIKVKNP